MLVISFTKVVESAKELTSLSKNLSGNIISFDDLFLRENLVKLENNHEGLFSFLAFHPAADKSIVEYIRKGTLSSDSGPNILVLFTLDIEAKSTKQITPHSFSQWLELDESIHPSYQAIRFLFENGYFPPLPGIVFFNKFTETKINPVYIDLQGFEDEAYVRDKLRKIFSLAEHAFLESKRENKEFSDYFSVTLQRHEINYYKPGKKSMMEWLTYAHQCAYKNKGDIVTLVKLAL